MQSQNMPEYDRLERDLSPNPQNLSENDPNVARDPVCGMLVDKRTAQNTLAAPVNVTSVDTFYFCSAQCKATFEQDPQQFGYNL